MKRTKWVAVACATMFLTCVMGGGHLAQSAPVGKAVARATAKKLSQRAAYQKLGPIHKFEKPQSLIRWTNRPKTDAVKGITGSKHDRRHVFTQYPHSGRKGSPESAQRRLAIDHKVKDWERIKAPAGTRYHVRPIREAPRGQEVLLHGPIPPRWVESGGARR